MYRVRMEGNRNVRIEDSTTARDSWGDVMDHAQFVGDVLINRRGKPAVVMISHEDWERYIKPVQEGQGDSGTK